jgi:NAD(P)-dependent dehydrogenase (short-subunit alcohol dehydrogenase family)
MKKVLITGGSKGIGLEIVNEFINEECDVYVLARDSDSLPEEVLEKVTFIAFDLNNTGRISEVIEKTGPIDILINNAGVLNSLPYDAYDTDKRDSLMRVNVLAPVELITQYSQLMIRNGGGRIVNMASIAGIIGQSDVWYAISKAAIINMTKTFAKLIGPQGIVINAVAPGPVKTDMFSLIPPERRQKVLDRTISGSPAKPSDVAEVVVWLSLRSPSHLNGVCIDMTNGAMLR